ncbi:hypothetical protein V2I71_09570 [Peribacillus frigoritolerans]|uniref:hypothetical protein n=1 Tax=Peribacillus frigoritolerans TaxID=450367 RepID=UPI002ED2BB41|nr:hypothetical protein V2I71_09570 [Peribacillus frigoritolerans]
MFLIPTQIKELDYIMNSFEVAYRSLISDVLLVNYPNEYKFEEKIIQLSNIYQKPADGIVPAQFLKYASKINKYKSKKSIKEIYSILDYCKSSIEKSDYEKGTNDVFYVSQLIDLVLIFYPIFNNLGNGFGRIEDFEENLINYLTIRNAASHPASSKISVIETQEIINFIVKSIDSMDSMYFWYVSKTEIHESSRDLLNNLDKIEPIKHNLSAASKKHKNLLERDSELEKLKKLIIGEGKIKRTSGSIVLHGSGGVGKTALVLEFCYDQVLKSIATPDEKVFDFIYWVSSKEEELTYHQSLGKLEINKLQTQFSTYDDLQKLLSSFFELPNSNEEELINYFETKSGIIVLDNYETIPVEEKEKINDFIKMCPRDIHFIITSRIIEDVAEDSIPLLGFDDSNGKMFIQKYCEDNFYFEKFDDTELDQFIKESCGNSLIIVLSLGQIIDRLADMNEIISSLRHFASSDVEILTDFMYKNMFEEIISLGKNKKWDIGNLLNIMLLYDDPIDLYSLRDLSEIDMKELEDLLSILGNKLIISKQKGGFYKLNELAIKFAIIRTLPNSIGVQSLLNKIEAYKNKINKDLKQLAKDKKMYPVLQEIIKDWEPLTQSEQIAMAQSYTAHDRLKSKLHDNLKIDQIKQLIIDIDDEFDVIRQRSNHPYIKFQHARVLKLLLKYGNQLRINNHMDVLAYKIKDAYSNAYTEIWIRYRHIMRTKSYLTFLIQYGGFLNDNQDPEEAFKILEQCTKSFDSRFNDEVINKFDSYYYLSQAAVNCSSLNEEFRLQYIASCRSAISQAFLILPLLEQANLPDYRRDNIKKKQRTLHIIEIYCLIIESQNYRKRSMKQRYNSIRTTRIPFSVKWIKRQIEIKLFA